MKNIPVINWLVYSLIFALSLFALGLVASSDSASNFATAGAVYQGF